MDSASLPDHSWGGKCLHVSEEENLYDVGIKGNVPFKILNLHMSASSGKGE